MKMKNLKRKIPPSKKVRSETLVLDDEETEIASGLRPIKRRSAAIQSDEDDAGSLNGNQNDGDIDVEGGDAVDDFRHDAVDDFNGQGLNSGFENNGVRLSFSSHDKLI